MVQAVSAESARQTREFTRSVGTGEMGWRTDYIGKRAQMVEGKPHAFLVEQVPGVNIGAHFHHVDQFQVFVAGAGTLGRNAIPGIALHYVDHHTAYGPILAGPLGLSFFTIRARFDPFAVFLNKPGYKDHLKPTKKRYLMADSIALSTEPVLQNRSTMALENLSPETNGSDGLGVSILRLGAGMTTTGPDPRITGGQYYVVVNGSLLLDGKSYAGWSLVHADATDTPLEVRAGPNGLEVLILNFPRPDQ